MAPANWRPTPDEFRPTAEELAAIVAAIDQALKAAALYEARMAGRDVANVPGGLSEEMLRRAALQLKGRLQCREGEEVVGCGWTIDVYEAIDSAWSPLEELERAMFTWKNRGVPMAVEEFVEWPSLPADFRQQLTLSRDALAEALDLSTQLRLEAIEATSRERDLLIAAPPAATAPSNGAPKRPQRTHGNEKFPGLRQFAAAFKEQHPDATPLEIAKRYSDATGNGVPSEAGVRSAIHRERKARGR